MGAFADQMRKQYGSLDPDDPNAPDADRPLEEPADVEAVADPIPGSTVAAPPAVAKPLEDKDHAVLAKAAGEKTPPPPAAKPIASAPPVLSGSSALDRAREMIRARDERIARDETPSSVITAPNPKPAVDVTGNVARVQQEIRAGKPGEPLAAAEGRAEAARRAGDPVANDPLAQGILANTVAAGAGGAIRLGGALGAGLKGMTAGGVSAGTQSPNSGLDFVRDVARGGVEGLGLGVGTYGLGKYLLGAPKRVDRVADTEILGKTSGAPREAMLTERGTVKPEIKELRATDKGLKAAQRKGDYQGQIDLANKKIDPHAADNEAIYQQYAEKMGATTEGVPEAIPSGTDLVKTQKMRTPTDAELMAGRPMGGVNIAEQQAARAGLPEPVENLEATQKISYQPASAKLPPPTGSKLSPDRLNQMADAAEARAAAAEKTSLGTVQAEEFRRSAQLLRDKARGLVERGEKGPPAGRPAGSEIVNPQIRPPAPAVIPDPLAASALKELQALRDRAGKSLSEGGTGAGTAYTNQLDSLIERFGKGGKVSAQEMRNFMSEQVAVKPGERNVAPRGADAQTDAYFVLRDKVLGPEIERVLGKEAAARLQKNNDMISRWSTVRDAAKQQAEKVAGKESDVIPRGVVRTGLRRARNAVDEFVSGDVAQGAAKANAAAPGVAPAYAASPERKESHPVREAMDLLKTGVSGAKSAYDFIFGARGKNPGGYDPTLQQAR